MFQRLFIRLFVAFIEVTPVVTAHVGIEVDAERRGAGRGD